MPSLHEIALTLDNSIQLHYATHSATPLLSKILQTSSSLLSCRITNDDVAILCELGPFYTLTTRSDHEIVIDVNSYESRTNDLAAKTGKLPRNCSDITKGLLPYIKNRASTKATSPSKVAKRSQLLRSLSNSKDKFTFKERSESEETAKTGLSILERIRLKEQRKKSSETENDEDPRTLSILEKSGKVYDIIYNQCGPKSKVATFDLKKLTATCQNSIDYPLSDKEVHTMLRHIVDCLQQFTWVEADNSKDPQVVIRVVGTLNRGHDLPLLRTTHPA
ncbi:hypothetical protein DICA3_B03620 [Diutina catenulata]